MPSDVEVMERVTGWLVASAENITHDQLALATPCAEWDVGELLDHLIGGNRFTVAILGGATGEQGLAVARASFADDEDPATAIGESSKAQLAAFGNADLDQTYHHVVRDFTGHQILALRIHDIAIHIWDLLQAVNPRKGLDPVYVRWAIAELASSESLAVHHMANQFPKPTTSYELLLAFGRRRVARRIDEPYVHPHDRTSRDR